MTSTGISRGEFRLVELLEHFTGLDERKMCGSIACPAIRVRGSGQGGNQGC